MCLAASGLYIAGGVSAGGVTTLLVTKLLRKRPEPDRIPTSTKAEGDDHATTDHRIE
jgi:hypothetical protein